MIKVSIMLILLLVFVKSTVVAAWHSDYEAYVNAFQGKIKSSLRERIFLDSLERIKLHNAKNLTWKAGINQFSDMTSEEFDKLVLMDPQDCSATNGNERSAPSNEDSHLPAHLDWRERGIVSEVKNQGFVFALLLICLCFSGLILTYSHSHSQTLWFVLDILHGRMP